MLVTRIQGDCAGCGGKACFGIVNVYGDHVLRGCQHCRNSERIPLPPLRKAVIYLDQCFFSGAFRGGDERFLKAADRIKQLSAMQLLVAPYSSVHEDETHQWERRDELEEFIKATSRGKEFEPAYDVEREQVVKGFQAWLRGDPVEYVLEESDALPRDIHEWDGYFRIDVGRYTADRELIRALKRESIQGLVNLFDGWRKTAATFDADVQAELAEAGKNYLGFYLDRIARLAGGDYGALLNAPMASMVVEAMLHCLPGEMPADEKLKKCAQFFGSGHFAALPYHAIQSATFAALKAMVRSGAYANKEKAIERLGGFFYDVKHTATYAPYSQAFVMDKPMADLISHPSVALEQRYGVKIFSLNNWDELFGWLNALEATMDDWHKASLAAAYP